MRAIWVSTKARFSSITSTSSRPCAKRSIICCSIGQAESDLVEPHAEAGEVVQVEFKQVERLTQIRVGLADGGKADPCRTGIDNDAIDGIGAREGGDRLHLRSVQALLLRERRIGDADVQSVRRHLEVGRDDEIARRRQAPSRRTESMVSVSTLNAAQQPE